MAQRGFKTRIWNEETDAILREMFPHYTMDDIAQRIGCSDTSVSNRAKKLGLKRSQDYNQHVFSGRYTYNKGLFKNSDLPLSQKKL